MAVRHVFPSWNLASGRIGMARANGTEQACERDGHKELRDGLSASRNLLASIGLFSVFVNLLMLTGPLFMLQLYDRVLTSRSEATLLALVGITAFLFLMLGLVDHARGLVLARVGSRFQARFDARVLGATLIRAGRSPEARTAPATGPQDLEAMQRFASGQGPFAFFDAPWTPIFLTVLFAFHWLIGVLAVVSGALLVGVALANQTRTSRLQAEAGEMGELAFHAGERFRTGGETLRGLGMRTAAVARVGALREQALAATIAASDRGGAFAVASRTLRLFLQSMMLGLGAWLAIRGEVTPGVMIAASILLGRALAPVDLAITQWPILQRALRGRRALAQLLSETPEEVEPLPLPTPRGLLEAHEVVVVPPGANKPAVWKVSFQLEPGRAVGVAGPSGAGKSSLARALAGVWDLASGEVTLDGASLDQYGEAARAALIGWLPQEVVLFDGTVAENIARLAPNPDPEAVVRAARQGGAHEMILTLPGGYNCPVISGGATLSGGQRQRIALARAFYDDPMVVILDEPDAHLDQAGNKALNQALKEFKARGGAAVVVAHRRSAFVECDQVLLMHDGQIAPSGREALAEPARDSRRLSPTVRRTIAPGPHE